MLHLERDLPASCKYFRESARDPKLPAQFCGVYSVPLYDEAFSLPDLNSRPLIDENSFIPKCKVGQMHPGQPYMIFTADYNYFIKYYKQVVASLEASEQALNIMFGVHCSDRDIQSTISHFEDIAQSMSSDNHLSLVHINTSSNPVNDMRAFYTVMRFYLAKWVLAKYSTGIVTYDIDIKFNDVYCGRVPKSLKHTDVALNFNRGVRTYVPWRTVNANCFGLSQTKRANLFLEYLLKYIDYFFDRNEGMQWFIDQQGLFWTVMFISRFMPGIRALNNYETGVEFRTAKV